MELQQQILETALKLGREYIYLPFTLHLFETVSSTNQVIWNLLDQGAESGSVVIATQQTAGRGQWGRQWISPKGGLYLSVAIDANLEAVKSYQLTLATAWGISEQLQKYGIPVGIKWPNDLVLEERKLGGILTETKVNGGQITQAVIGVGINWVNPVPETGISLELWQASRGCRPISSLSILASVILLGIESGIQCLFVEGVNILLSRYLKLLTNMDERVYVEDVLGTIVGVTDSGDLRVRVLSSEPQLRKTPEIFLQPGTISLGYRKKSD